ncbi:IclR family transcriptional regulator [Brachybacterium sp. EF45031]|uniref:IclR family transcriptional regulator n=1 Tax=Brachybacterium sillae TaxID=2810536 RepID=UPI00217EE995|nr:IclR family transcriptional regulator [Brachybacterium sillae]MCS6711931.1 IclR family transcriptional regulator [Brachybacterium sillae]
MAEQPAHTPAAAAAPKAPAADATLRVLTFLAAQRGPVPAARVAAELSLPRSTTYDLLATLVQHGYALHLAADRQYALGPAAYELAAGYSRHAPLARVGRRAVERLVDSVGESGHLAVLHGADVLYIVEERARSRSRASLVTDIGVRLPAHLTASGLAMLAQMPPAHVRTLYGGTDDFLQRTSAPDAPHSPSSLRTALTAVRRDGVAYERGFVTEGFSSVAAPILDRAGWPLAAVALTWKDSQVDERQVQMLAQAVQRTAEEITRVATGQRRS